MPKSWLISAARTPFSRCCLTACSRRRTSSLTKATPSGGRQYVLTIQTARCPATLQLGKDEQEEDRGRGHERKRVEDPIACAALGECADDGACAERVDDAELEEPLVESRDGDARDRARAAS